MHVLKRPGLRATSALSLVTCLLMAGCDSSSSATQVTPPSQAEMAAAAERNAAAIKAADARAGHVKGGHVRAVKGRQARR